MGFERVSADDVTGKRTGSKTGGNDRRGQLVKTIAQWLEHGLAVVEVHRHQGRAGWVIQWSYELVDDGMAEVEGITVRGVNPEAFTDALITDVQQHAGDRGNAGYLVVGQEAIDDDDGSELKPCFRFSIPKAWLGEIPDGDEQAEGATSAIGCWKDLVVMQQRYIGDLHKVGLEKDRNVAAVVDANAKGLLAHAEAVGKTAPQVELELAKLEMDRHVVDQEAAIHRQRAAADRNGRLIEKVIDVVGPDLVGALRMWLAKHGPISTDDDEAQDLDGPCAQAAELAAILADCTEMQRSKARKIIGDDAWSLLEAASQATSEAAFVAVLGRLNALLSDPALKAKFITELPKAIGPDLTRRLFAMFQRKEEDR